VTKIGEKLAPTLANYQYFGFQQKCRATPRIPLNINACVQNFTKGNELIMKQLVANVGPIASVVDVTLQFQLYKSGIYSDTKCDCSCSHVNHAVIIVGYGTDPKTKMDYWLIKNSWVGSDFYSIDQKETLCLALFPKFFKIQFRANLGDKLDTCT